FAVRNPFLEQLLEEKGANTPATWDSILQNEGSVQHLDVLTQDEKDIYKTAFEIDQRWVVELAADRQPDICQSQSINIFLPGDVDKWDLHMLHWQAWERGCKSLYYLRSKSVQRASHAGGETHAAVDMSGVAKTDYEECLACQ
ncbi:MAG TPA: ribonucleotide-diphosphate reductase subunit alpha, partial [Phenylobacterium sp.]|nr:ribonucleotide-diphosphate reductase subunit alpha [Phenylobacterium sp.]